MQQEFINLIKLTVTFAKKILKYQIIDILNLFETIYG
jgi:hypothetical protein